MISASLAREKSAEINQLQVRKGEGAEKIPVAKVQRSSKQGIVMRK